MVAIQWWRITNCHVWRHCFLSPIIFGIREIELSFSSYEVAVGTQPGYSDIQSYKPVKTLDSIFLYGLDLPTGSQVYTFLACSWDVHCFWRVRHRFSCRCLRLFVRQMLHVWRHKVCRLQCTSVPTQTCSYLMEMQTKISISKTIYLPWVDR